MLFLLLVSSTYAQTCPLTCTNDTQCFNCGDPSFQGHDYYVGAGITFSCVSGHCALDLASVPANTVAACDASSGPCCVPSGDFVTDKRLCQTKKCTFALGCLPYGFCLYDDALPTYNKCCRFAGDCPLLPDPPPVGPFAMECTVPFCGAEGNCEYTIRSGCCVSNLDCATTAPLQGVCVRDGITNLKNCDYVYAVGNECDANLACNYISVCSIGTCEGYENINNVPYILGTCTFAPLSSPPLATGCCNDNTPAGMQLCNTGDVCKVPTSCFDQTVLINGVHILPTYECLYADLTSRGCCQSNSQCFFASTQNECVQTNCDVINNKCILSSTAVVPNGCCYSNPDCPAQDPNNLCQFYACNGPPQERTMPFVELPNAFHCFLETIPGCDPNIRPEPPINMAVSFPQNSVTCVWTCGTPNSDVYQFSFGFEHDVGILYGFDLTLTASNAFNVDNVLSILLVDFSTTDLERTIPPISSLFNSSVVQNSGGVFIVKFSMLPVAGEYFAQYTTQFETERFTLTLEIPTTPNALVTSLQLTVDLQRFDVCAPFWFGNPNCASAADSLNKIYRAPVYHLIGDGAPCTPPCLPPTTTAPETMMTFPLNLGGPNFVSSITKTVALENCQWTCNSTDERLNRLIFTLTETNLAPVTINSAQKYFLGLLFEVNHIAVLFKTTFSPASVPNPVVASEPSIVGWNGNAVFFNPDNVQVNVAFPIALLPGQSLSFNITVFFSILSHGSIITKAFTTVGFEKTYLCTTALASEQFCSTSDIGHNVMETRNPQAGSFLPYGPGPNDCTDNPCPVRPGSVLFPAFLIQNFSCYTDCSRTSDPRLQNLFIYELCAENPNTGATSVAFRINHWDFHFQCQGGSSFLPYFSVNADTFFVTTNDSRIIRPQLVTGSLTEFRVVFDPPLVVLPEQSQCFTLEFYRNPFFPTYPCLFGIGHFDNIQVYCTIDDIEAGNCLLPSSVAASSDPFATAIIGGHFRQYTCDLCTAGSIPNNTVGARIFYDFNGNGVVDFNDSYIVNVPVQAVDVNSQLVLAGTTTDANGYAIFNATALFNVSSLFVLVVPTSGIPAGYKLTIPYSPLNPFLHSVFTGSPPTSPNLFPGAAFTLFLGGFAPISLCKPDLGPYPNNTVLITYVGDNCTECTRSKARPPPTLKCSDTVCFNASVRRIVDLTFNVSNFGTSPSGPASVRVEFLQAQDNIGTSKFICADGFAYNSTDNMFIITNAHGAAKLSDKGGVVLSAPHMNNNAYATFGWDSIPLGANVLSFTVRFSYCALDDLFAYNVTVTVDNNDCAALLKGWQSCSINGGHVDYRQCYAQQINLANEPCDVGCPNEIASSDSDSDGGIVIGIHNLNNAAAIPAPPQPPPTEDSSDDFTPAPTPTFGPPGMSTPIAATIFTLLDGPMCVTKPLILAQKCGDHPRALAQCKGAGARGLIIVRYVLQLKPGAEGEAGEALVTLVRLSPSSTLFCGRFDPDLIVTVTRNGHPREHRAFILSKKVVQSSETLTVNLGFLKFDSVTNVILDVVTIECLPTGPLPVLSYNATVRLFTSGCNKETGCTTNELISNIVFNNLPTECTDAVVINNPELSGRHRHLLAKRSIDSEKTESSDSNADDDDDDILDDDDDSNGSHDGTSTGLIIAYVLIGLAIVVTIGALIYLIVYLVGQKKDTRRAERTPGTVSFGKRASLQ